VSEGERELDEYAVIKREVRRVVREETEEKVRGRVAVKMEE